MKFGITVIVFMLAFAINQDNGFSIHNTTGHYDHVFGSNYNNNYIADYISEFSTQRENWRNYYTPEGIKPAPVTSSFPKGRKKCDWGLQVYYTEFSSCRENTGNDYTPAK